MPSMKTRAASRPPTWNSRTKMSKLVPAPRFSPMAAKFFRMSRESCTWALPLPEVRGSRSRPLPGRPAQAPSTRHLADGGRHEQVDDPDDEGREQRPQEADAHPGHEKLGSPNDDGGDDKTDNPPAVGGNAPAHEGFHDPAQGRDDHRRQEGAEEPHGAEAGHQEGYHHEHNGRDDKAHPSL